LVRSAEAERIDPVQGQIVKASTSQLRSVPETEEDVAHRIRGIEKAIRAGLSNHFAGSDCTLTNTVSRAAQSQRVVGRAGRVDHAGFLRSAGVAGRAE